MRLLLLSNRLTRWSWAGKDAVQSEYRRLLLAESRMADVLFAANGIETCYLRIRQVAAGLARTPPRSKRSTTPRTCSD